MNGSIRNLLASSIVLGGMGYWSACKSETKAPVSGAKPLAKESPKTGTLDSSTADGTKTEDSSAPDSDAPTASAGTEVKIRAPATKENPSTTDSFPPPKTEWLTSSPWKVTYSTLPNWKTGRNVQITYTLIPAENTVDPERLDDLVEYQSPLSDKVLSIKGIDVASTDIGKGWAWDWRGSGLLKITTSHWEVLGYGPKKSLSGETSKGEWAVTYFAKTLFTPAGIDIYSRPDASISPELLVEIKKKLKETKDPTVMKLADEIFQVKHNP